MEYIYKFELSPDYLELLHSIGEMSDASYLVVSHVFDAQQTLTLLAEDGIDYLVTHTGMQANVVLNESIGTTLTFMRIEDPGLMVYQIRSDRLLNPGPPIIEKVSPFAGPQELLSLRRNAEPEGFGGKMFQSTPEDVIFENNVSAYDSWQESWWREALQNSSDACKEALEKYGRRGRITCEIIENRDKEGAYGGPRIYIQVKDNGIGMDLLTLGKAFLTLGGSAKRGKPGAVGGLGLAKELLIHISKAWAIHSRAEGEPANRAVFAKGKFDPQYFQLYEFAGTPKKEEIPEEAEGRWIGYFPRKEVGTTLIVEMRPGLCVSQDDLLRFLGFSDIPHVQIKFRKVTIEGGVKTYNNITTDEKESWIVTPADNKITKAYVNKPHKILRRTTGVGWDRQAWIAAGYDPDDRELFGSPWAEIYHMPRSKRSSEIPVRIGGLYMYALKNVEEVLKDPSFKGKAIIELEYLPKGKKWDYNTSSWIPLEPSLAASQESLDYGPLEMVSESRTTLKEHYARQLSLWVVDLITKPDITLKRRRDPVIFEVKNAPTEKKPWNDILENLEPKQVLLGDKGSVDRMGVDRTEDIIDLLKKIAEEQAEEGDAPPSPRVVREAMTDNQIARAQDMAEKGELPEELAEIVTQSNLTINIDTSADFDFWNNTILPMIWEDARADGKGDMFVKNAIKFLNWEPNFILRDEVASAEEEKVVGEEETESPNRDQHGHLFPRAPDKFYPAPRKPGAGEFGTIEKRLAKFWIELLRLCFIVSGEGGRLLDRDGEGLKVGFLFENPPTAEEQALSHWASLEALGTFQALWRHRCPSCKGSNPLQKSRECRHCGYNIWDDKSTKALAGGIVSLAPAFLNVPDPPAKSSWRHRYSIVKSSKKTFIDPETGKKVTVTDRVYIREQAELVSIAFHEMAHALHPGGGHDVEFASIVTHQGLKNVFRYKELIFKIRNYCIDKFKIRGSRRTGNVPHGGKSRSLRRRNPKCSDCGGIRRSWS